MYETEKDYIDLVNGQIMSTWVYQQTTIDTGTYTSILRRPHLYNLIVDFSELKGKIFTNIVIYQGEKDKEDMIVFTCSDGSIYEMFHDQECCEQVDIEEIAGDINNLLGYEILIAQENRCDADTGKDSTETWTFYKLATIKGWVDIRWFGSSNGYYSEYVTLHKVVPD